jgi:hypothetical protein
VAGLSDADFLKAQQKQKKHPGQNGQYVKYTATGFKFNH